MSGHRASKAPASGQRGRARAIGAASATAAVAVVGLALGWWLLGRSAGPERGTQPGSANGAAPASGTARSVVLVTIDTLRADRVGVYGARGATTPNFDGVARRGIRFNRAYANAPITLTSHASLLTGLYPPGHGGRHNGMHARGDVPTLATTLRAAGFATAAFVSAFPLDRRFGLARGFDVYDDTLGRDRNGRPLNERPGRRTVDGAREWLAAHKAGRFFLWVHLFEPHAPYGEPARPGEPRAPLLARYDREVAEADAQVGRLLERLGEAAASTLVVVTSDHGEAFGEHGEIGHSIFVYDTTLQVPLAIAGPGVAGEGRVIEAAVTLADLAPTVLSLVGVKSMDADGLDVSGVVGGGAAPAESRLLYAESFAPLIDFGWSPLRSVRQGSWKYIAAPRPELYEIGRDRVEQEDRVRDEPGVSRDLADRVERISPAALREAPAVDGEVSARLGALGYVSGSLATRRSGDRPDPKDRRDLAARLAQVTSGEVTGDELVSTLEAILEDDPGNPQAALRLGYAWLERNDCGRAVPHLRTAAERHLPTADPWLGLALCDVQAQRLAPARSMLLEARRVEPGNPVVEANLGLVELDLGAVESAVASLERALALDPDLHRARFALARALATQGNRAGAARQVEDLLRRLPPDAPQRAEVERLRAALR